MNRFAVRVFLAAACACLLTLFGCSGVTDSSSVAGSGQPSASDERRRVDPTAARRPHESKSLTLSADWQPPSPTRTQPARRKARVQVPRQYGVATPTVGPRPSHDEIARLPLLPEPLRPVPGASSNAETEALASALREETSRGDRGIDGLRRFAEAHPQSRWAPSIQLNLGSIAYHAGYFQEALTHWKAAWDLAKAGQDLVSEQIANQAVAAYAKMSARVGRMAELEVILAEAQGRTFMGDARVKMESALEGLWMMRNRPGVAFRCGPYALLNVAEKLKPEALKKTTAFLDKVKSPQTGFSLSAVQAMSSDLGLELQMAKRAPGAGVIVPSVVHWKVGHFGALVREQNGQLLLKDPTFGNET